MIEIGGQCFNMNITTDFISHIKEILANVGIGRGINEYQRGKDILPYDLSADEYELAVRILAKWCGV